MNANEFAQMDPNQQKRWLDRYEGERDPTTGMAVVEIHDKYGNRTMREFLGTSPGQWMDRYKAPIQRQIKIANCTETREQREKWLKWYNAPAKPLNLGEYGND